MGEREREWQRGWKGNSRGSKKSLGHAKTGSHSHTICSDRTRNVPRKDPPRKHATSLEVANIEAFSLTVIYGKLQM